jgi:hypothetical protein
MAWVEARTVFGEGPPEVTGRLRGDLAGEPTQVDRRPLGASEEASDPDGVVLFEDDVTAPYLAFEWEPTAVDGRPLR